MNIKELRRKCYMTQKEFAEKLNVSIQTVNYWESGDRNPSLRHQKAIVQICKENNIEIC